MDNWVGWLSDATGIQRWALAVFAIILTALLLDYIQRRVARKLAGMVEATENLWDDAVFHAAVKPLSLLIWVVGLTIAALFVPFAEDSDLLSAINVNRARQIGVLIALTWFLMRLVAGVEKNLIQRARVKGQKVDAVTIHAVARLTRIAVLITGLLVMLDTLGFSVSGLMAAGGIGGIAIGFAARDLLANFFGGLTIFLDRPFAIGDWIRSPDRSIEGVVERIGWRQTTIRKFDRRPMYVPNSTFLTITVENPSRMTHRRLNETLGIRYQDMGRMEGIVQSVRDMLKQHPAIDDSQTLMVNFDAFGASSINFFIYCLTHTVDWQEFHTIKQDVLLKIAHIVEQHGAEFAFPTTTVHIESEPQWAGMPEAEPGKP